MRTFTTLAGAVLVFASLSSLTVADRGGHHLHARHHKRAHERFRNNDNSNANTENSDYTKSNSNGRNEGDYDKDSCVGFKQKCSSSTSNCCAGTFCDTERGICCVTTGSSCSSSSDCLYGLICDPYSKTCAHEGSTSGGGSNPPYPPPSKDCYLVPGNRCSSNPSSSDTAAGKCCTSGTSCNTNGRCCFPRSIRGCRSDDDCCVSSDTCKNGYCSAATTTTCTAPQEQCGASNAVDGCCPADTPKCIRTNTGSVCRADTNPVTCTAPQEQCSASNAVNGCCPVDLPKCITTQTGQICKTDTPVTCQGAQVDCQGTCCDACDPLDGTKCLIPTEPCNGYDSCPGALSGTVTVGDDTDCCPSENPYCVAVNLGSTPTCQKCPGGAVACNGIAASGLTPEGCCPADKPVCVPAAGANQAYCATTAPVDCNVEPNGTVCGENSQCCDKQCKPGECPPPTPTCNGYDSCPGAPSTGAGGVVVVGTETACCPSAYPFCNKASPTPACQMCPPDAIFCPGAPVVPGSPRAGCCPGTGYICNRPGSSPNFCEENTCTGRTLCIAGATDSKVVDGVTCCPVNKPYCVIGVGTAACQTCKPDDTPCQGTTNGYDGNCCPSTLPFCYIDSFDENGNPSLDMCHKCAQGQASC